LNEDKFVDLHLEAAERALELSKLRAMERHFKAMLPLFQEARDAICAISTTTAKIHNISLVLAECMDDVGILERWKKLDKISQNKKGDQDKV